jgi:exosome complex protein LRP1
MSSSASSFPSELNSVVADLHTNLTHLESTLEPIVERQTRAQLVEKAEAPIDKAKVDVAAAYTINSLVWMWMKTRGENPKESEVKDELDRVKTSMVRLKEIQDRSKRAKVDVHAAKRIVKSGLWKPGQRKEGQEGEGQEQGRKSEPRAKRGRK